MDDNKTKVGVFLCEDTLLSRSLIFKLLSEQDHEVVIVNKEEDIKGHDYDAVILDEFEDYVGKLAKPIGRYEIACKDDHYEVKLEPYWMQQQRNKNFKRGK